MPLTIAITGVTHDPARALLPHLLQGDHRVFGVAPDHIQTARLNHTLQPPLPFRAIDLTDDLQVQSWAEDLFTRAGPPDLILFCPDLSHRAAPPWQLFPDELNTVVDGAIKGAAAVIRHLLPTMLDRQRGVFTVVTEQHPAAGQSARTMAGFALDGLVQSISLDLPPGMSALTLRPQAPLDTWARSVMPTLLG